MERASTHFYFYLNILLIPESPLGRSEMMSTLELEGSISDRRWQLYRRLGAYVKLEKSKLGI